MFGSTVNSGFGTFGGASTSLAPSLTPAWGQALYLNAFILVLTVNSAQNQAALANEWLGDGKGTSEHDFKPTYCKESTGSYLTVYLQSIMVQPEYKKFCHEELRMQDYLQGRIFGENPFAHRPQPNAGTRAHPFVETRDKDLITNTLVSYQTISLMPQYKGNSVEELRMEDYRQGLIFAGENTSGFGSLSSGFGAPTFGSASSSTSFAATSTPGFGAYSAAPSGFGSTSAFGSSTFGTSSGFGAKPATGFSSTLTATSGFGTQSTTGFASNPFGSTSSAFGGVGTQNTSTFGGTSLQSNSGFGAFGAQPSGTSTGTGPGTGFTSGFGTGAGFGTGTSSGFGTGTSSGFGTGAGFGTGTSSAFGAGAGFGTGTSSGFGTGFGAGAGFGAGTATSFGAGAFGANQPSGSMFGAKSSTGFMTSQPTNTFGSFGQASNSFSGFSNSQSSKLAPTAPTQPPKPSPATLNPWGNIVLFDDLKKSEPTVASVIEVTKPPPVEDNKPKVSSEDDDYAVDLDGFFVSDKRTMHTVQSLDDPLPFFTSQYFSASEDTCFQVFDVSTFLAPPLRYNVPLRQAPAISEAYSIPPISTTITPAHPRPDVDS